MTSKRTKTAPVHPWELPPLVTGDPDVDAGAAEFHRRVQEFIAHLAASGEIPTST